MSHAELVKNIICLSDGQLEDLRRLIEDELLERKHTGLSVIKVTLGPATQRIPVLKLHRELTGLGLAEAVEAFRSGSYTFEFPPRKAERAWEGFEALGCTVEVIR